MFISLQNHWLSRVALYTTVLILAYVLLEIYTKMNGPLIPSIYVVMALMSKIITISVVFLTLALWYYQRQLGFLPSLLSMIALLLIAFNILWAEHLLLASGILQLTLHVTLLGLIWWLRLLITQPKRQTAFYYQHKKYRIWAWAAFFALCIEIFCAEFILSYSTYSLCNHFLLCNIVNVPILSWQAFILPSYEQLIFLHYIDRIGLLLVSIYMGLLSLRLLFDQQFFGRGFLLLLLLSIFVTTQVLMMLQIGPLWLGLGNYAIATLLLLALISLLTHLYRKQRSW